MNGEVEITPKKTFSPFLRQCFVISGVFFNMFDKGAILGFSSILLPALRDPQSTIHLTANQESWTASVIGFTQIAGLFIMMAATDILGRRPSHLLSAITLQAAWCILIFADGFPSIMIARLLQGLGMGISGTLGTVIIGEMSEPKLRGSFFVGFSISFTVGILSIQAIGQFLTWQYTALIFLFMNAISIIIMNYSPESPSWLISKGRVEECKENFRWLRGTGPQSEDELEKLISGQLVNKNLSSTTENLTFYEKLKQFSRYLNVTYKKPEFFKPMIITFHIIAVLNFSGANVLNSYIGDIIMQLIGPDTNVKLIVVFLNLIRLISSFVALAVVKYSKRRTVLMTTGLLCILLYLGKGVYVAAKQNNLLPYDSQWIPIFLIFSFVFVISAGLSTTTFIVLGEILPLEYRGWGSGVTGLYGSLLFIISVKYFPVLILSVGLGLTYCFYAGVTAYCLIVLWFILPETKDKTLQDIEDNFRGRLKFAETTEKLLIKT